MTKNDICIDDECKLPVLVKSRMMCSRHYQRYIRSVKKDRPQSESDLEYELNPVASRVCTDCKKDLPISEFTYKIKRCGSSTRRVCTACANVRLRIKRKGLSIDQYLNLLEDQNHTCKICELEFMTGGRRPTIDHDHNCCAGAHTCGKCVRGLLCAKCNTGIGMLQDDPTIIKKALHYLENGIII